MSVYNPERDVLYIVKSVPDDVHWISEVQKKLLFGQISFKNLYPMDV